MNFQISKRSNRVRRRPLRYEDYVQSKLPPEAVLPVSKSRSSGRNPETRQSAAKELVSQPIESQTDQSFSTQPDQFGIIRTYRWHPHFSSKTPDDVFNRFLLPTPKDKQPFIIATATKSTPVLDIPSIIAPWKNVTQVYLHWLQLNGSKFKTNLEWQKIIEFLRSPYFKLDDLPTTDWGYFIREIETVIALSPVSSTGDQSEKSDIWEPPSGWKSEIVEIKLDWGSQHHTFQVPNFQRRCLTEWIQSLLENHPCSQAAHYTPYTAWFQPPPMPSNTDPPKMRIYRELFEGQEWEDLHSQIVNLPPIEGCQRPRGIASIILYSDSTHPAQFGNATMWPVYGASGNWPMHLRTQSNLRGWEPVAFFQEVCDDYLIPNLSLQFNA
jgi:hypothetical protein